MEDYWEIGKGEMAKSVSEETKLTSQGQGIYRAGKGKGVLRAGYEKNNSKMDF